jgi:hypothetical protein
MHFWIHFCILAPTQLFHNILIIKIMNVYYHENLDIQLLRWLLYFRSSFRAEGKIVSVEAEPNLSNKDYRNTVKITWLADTKKAPFVPCICVYFDHIISKSVLGKDEDFKDYIGHNTRVLTLFYLTSTIGVHKFLISARNFHVLLLLSAWSARWSEIMYEITEIEESSFCAHVNSTVEPE